MMNKKSRKPLGLSDKELIKKYEAGESKSFNKVIKTMINTSAPGIEKREKKK
ncbi:MAG: hypothetical protein ABJA35_07510 [Parafilimonas sp.]